MSYRVLRQLSGGGFSEVFEVEDPESALPERLILKRLNADMSARPAVRAAFADEAKILRELKHPNVVTFRRCYFDENRRVCLLMEKVPGEALDAWARRHAREPEAVLETFERVLQAVDYLHRRATPFLHLDLKPDNILVSSSPQGPQPLLIDFGIARRSGGQGLKAYTPPYGAPEQQSGGTLDCSTDVHALGQILAELLDILALPEGPVRTALAAVAEKAKSPGRRARFMDAGEMGLAFRRAHRSAPVPEPAPGAISELLRKPRWVYAAAGGAALAAALLVVVLVMPGPSPDPAGSANQAAPVSDLVDVRRRFDNLLAQATEEANEGRYQKADDRYLEAKALWESMPRESEAARSMEKDLNDFRSQIDLVRYGGTLEERRLNAN
jgi:serine/threonine protein kinase